MISGVEIRGRQIELAIAVEVARGTAGRPLVPGKEKAVSERPVATTQDESDSGGKLATSEKILMPVAIEIPDYPELSRCTGRVPHLLLEGPIPVTQQHGNVPRVTIDRGQVRVAIPVVV